MTLLFISIFSLLFNCRDYYHLLILVDGGTILLPKMDAPALPDFMSQNVYIIAITCLCAILVISLFIIIVICIRQRRKITQLEKQVVEVEKGIDLTEEKPPMEGKDVITIKETPASQVWESDECIFYDLGSISRGVSQEVLDRIEAANEPAVENTEDKAKSSSTDEGKINDTLEGKTTTHSIEKDLGIDDNESVQSLQDGQDGPLTDLTDEIWVGDAKKDSHEKLSINDALSDISETGVMEDSGNETISNDDNLCPNVEEITEKGPEKENMMETEEKSLDQDEKEEGKKD